MKHAKEEVSAKPVCNSTDPRNEIKATDEYNAGSGGVCSQWPTPLGLAATFDTTVVASFAGAVKREYLALGFHKHEPLRWRLHS